MTNDIKDDDSKSEEGLAFRYPPRPKRRLSVAPSTFDDNRFNAIVFEGWPRPVACVKLDPERFPFDSSFPHATVAHDLARLFELRAPENKAGEKLAVFGHADPTGAEDYNKTLSGRRAKAVFALVSRQPELWDELHQQRFSGDTWGLESLQLCLQALGFDPGSTDGKASPKLTQATHDFQASDGLPKGPLDRPTRLALFRSYMDKLLGGTKDAPRSFAIEDFVGKGKAADFRGAFQGCGKRNPAMIVSAEQDRELQKEENHAQRDRVEAPNRRVLIFLYEPRSVRNLDAVWECPAASAPMSDCDKVKWKTMDQILKPGAKRREVRRKGQTFGCKFYDFQARLSPCEALRGTVKVFLRDEQGQKFAKPVDYEIRSFSSVRRGTTNKDGLLEEGDFPIDRSMVLSWLTAEPPAGAKSSPAPTAPNPPDAPEETQDEDGGEEPEQQDDNGPNAVEDRGAQADAVKEGDDGPSTGPTATTATAGGSKEETAPEAPTPASGESKFVHHARVFLPLVDEKDQTRRDLLWLQNLGFVPEPGDHLGTMAKFALEYGLAQNTPPAEQSKLLEDVQTTGREAKAPTATDTPAPSPEAEAGITQDVTATQRPVCRCDNAVTTKFEPSGSTFVSPNLVYVPLGRRVSTMTKSGILFEMPLFNSKFLFQELSSHKRPVRDPATKLWHHDRADPVKKDTTFVLKEVRGDTVTGVCEELSKRLDWAQRRLWFFFCGEATKAGEKVDAGAFEHWITHKQGVNAKHSALRSDRDTHHALGSAIDVGASASPFLCMREEKEKVVPPKTPPPPPDKDTPHKAAPKLFGEAHTAPDRALFPAEMRNRDKAAFAEALKSFYSDNAFEPAVAGFDRAVALFNNKKADLFPGKGQTLPLPKESPCEIPDNHINCKYFREDVLPIWKNLDEANTAWKDYVRPTTLAEFKAKVISVCKLTTAIAIDADLIKFAKANNNDDPPATINLEVEPVLLAGSGPTSPPVASTIRLTRKREFVTVGELKDGAHPENARAAFFQMLRDKESASMAMVKGKLSAIAASTARNPNDPNAKTLRRIPCAWPPGVEIVIPDTRKVEEGFLGVSELVARALVESGLCWLGGTGNLDGSPIGDFTGDIMHFDLRVLNGLGSTEMDDWLKDNATRHGYDAKIGQVFAAVAAIRQTLAAGAFDSEDPAPIVQKLVDAKALVGPTTQTPDSALETLIDGVLDSMKRLAAARDKKRSAYAANTDPSYDAADRAMSKAHLSPLETDADAALAEVNALKLALPALEKTDEFRAKYKTALGLGKSTVVGNDNGRSKGSLAGLAADVRSRFDAKKGVNKKSTDGERAPHEKHADDLGRAVKNLSGSP